MKRHSYILTIILTLTLGNAFAHQDFWRLAEYGNVKIRIKTGFDYEEINKTFIIGQLAKKLAKELNYTAPIFLDFNHYYVGRCKPVYFISYDKGNLQQPWEGALKDKDYLKENAIVVRQVSKQFDIISTLILLEHSIKNLVLIKSSQKQIEYNQNYCRWKINSIDTNQIKKLFEKPNSKLINRTIALRVERPDQDFKDGISYYWQDNKFHLFVRDYGKPDIALVSMNNVYGMKKFSSSSAIVFDSDSSFFYIGQHNSTIVSKRHIINNKYNYYEPFKVESIDGDKLSIYFSYYTKEEELQPKKRKLIYLIKKDELIQDLDKVVGKR